jgi:hypothetical protein
MVRRDEKLPPKKSTRSALNIHSSNQAVVRRTLAKKNEIKGDNISVPRSLSKNKENVCQNGYSK